MPSVDEASTIRVLIVDDHALFRQGVHAILSETAGIQVVGEADNGQQAVQRYQQLRPDVVVMDINMPIMNGLEATRQICAFDSAARILMLTVSDEEEALFEAVKSGALGYVLKTATPGTVVASLKQVHAREPVIPGNLAVKIIQEMGTPREWTAERAVDALTERELEVLRQLSTGASNRNIANALFISENTVRNHVRSILDKLHVSNRGQAAAFAMRKGYTIDSPDS